MYLGDGGCGGCYSGDAASGSLRLRLWLRNQRKVQTLVLGNILGQNLLKSTLSQSLYPPEPPEISYPRHISLKNPNAAHILFPIPSSNRSDFSIQSPSLPLCLPQFLTPNPPLPLRLVFTMGNLCCGGDEDTSVPRRVNNKSGTKAFSGQVRIFLARVFWPRCRTNPHPTSPPPRATPSAQPTPPPVPTVPAVVPPNVSLIQS